MKKLAKTVGVLLAASLLAPLGAVHAADEISVGVVVSTTGSGAVLGIPYRNVFDILPKEIAGQPAKYIVLDDTSDVTTGVRNAKKLGDEMGVDILVGSNSVPVTRALMQVADEAKVPLISLAPIELDPSQNPWTYGVPQPIPLMISAVLQHMKQHGVKKVGYIGFADAWGEAVHRSLQDQTIIDGLQITTDERYQRNDVSITTQALKVIGTKPDAVMVGGSGAPGALPHIALRERGFKGTVYNTHGSVSGDFIRIGGASAEGAVAPVGPFLFAGQLPDDSVVKPVAAKYLAMYDQAYGKEARSPFAGYAFDAYLLIQAAVPSAIKSAKPGTSEFRSALRGALENNVKEVVGTQGVYTMSPRDHNGLDERARVLVRVNEGKWVLAD
ncbi:MAG TPA: ABC transporter substrate-binding protein [Pusillimonas sp.]|uniref:ABC transporter substrate-binding protein n=1 Tax=Pusillimonas sp. TaxID=3040095 RepID=UPI002CA37D20|nr:ABC transporter substrate-binding protein [Pusillimonas sp.]HUH87953.1 ABC transporter substrate-binding protein [Pusillimonas sp.]